MDTEYTRICDLISILKRMPQAVNVIDGPFSHLPSETRQSPHANENIQFKSFLPSIFATIEIKILQKTPKFFFFPIFGGSLAHKIRFIK